LLDSLLQEICFRQGRESSRDIDLIKKKVSWSRNLELFKR